MSRNLTIQPNFQQNNWNSKQNTSNFAGKQNFGGVPSVAKDLSKEQKAAILETLKKTHLGKMGVVLDKLSESTGEIQNLLIMNAGTAFVAPIFIVNNPVSKDDINTKKYTAWRQPISAVIALAFGLGVNMPVPNYIDRLAADGKLDKFDLSAKPPEDYLKNRYNSIKKNFGKLKEEDKKYLDLVNRDRDKKITNVNEFTHEFASFPKFIEGVHKITLSDAADKLLDRLNTNGLYNKTLKDVLVENLKFDENYLDKSILNPESTKRKLSEVNAMAFLKAVGYSDAEASESTVRGFYNANIYKDRPDVHFSQGDRKLSARIAESFIEKGTKDKETLSLKQFLQVFDLDEKFASNKEMLELPMDKFLEWMHVNVNLPKSTPKNFKTFLKDHAIVIAKDTATKAAKNYGGYKKIQGIMLSLATLPFSCGLLNWAYPRIMEKCFPHLTKSPTVIKGGK